MLKLSYEDAFAKIKENSELTEDEINSRINAKLTQFAGLVSKEGAAHILANELGIKLITPQASLKQKISAIGSGMQNVEVLGKILAVYPARDFSTNGRSGKVGSMLIGDETGTIRVVFWNEQADKLNMLNRSDILHIRGSYVKQNKTGMFELHVNERTELIINPPGVSIEVKERAARQFTRKKIGELAESDQYVEILGTIVEAFEPRFFEDKKNPGQYSYVQNIFLDDGSASIRVAFFRDTALKLMKLTNEEMMYIKESPETFEQPKMQLLGNFIKLQARISKNEMFNRLESIASDVEPAKPGEAQLPQGPAEEQLE